MNEQVLANAQLMAEWWADQITTNKMNWDNGDSSESGGMAFLLANMVAMNARQTAPADARNRFIAGFMQTFQNFYKAHNHYPDLSVDYHPCEFLFKAANAAGIDAGAFPCKSHSYLSLTDGKAYAKVGYGKPYTCLNDLRPSDPL